MTVPARIGNYRPLLRLASGGMATVYVAQHTGAAGFDRFVVLKRVHPHLLTDGDFAKLFQAEVRICASISHPNVVPVFDVVDADGELSMVLDYVESVTLKELIAATAARGRRIPPAVVAKIFVDVLAGLHAAHETRDVQGNPLAIVHRDISPDNVVVGLDGTARLLDFGIAKAASRMFSTASGVLRGKLRYMSPEQLRGRSLDRRSDLFSVGATLHEALSGERLFDADDEGVIAMRVLTRDVPPIAENVGAPAEVDAVLAKALMRDAESRYATALDMQAALESALAPAPARVVAQLVDELFGDEIRARRVRLYDLAKSAPASALDDEAPDAASEATTATTEGKGPARRRYMVAVVAFAATAGATAFLVGQSRSASTPLASEAPVASVTPPSVTVDAAVDPPSSPSAAASSSEPPAASASPRATTVPRHRTAPQPPRTAGSPAVRAAPAERK